jgi:hypothetical protein
MKPSNPPLADTDAWLRADIVRYAFSELLPSIIEDFGTILHFERLIEREKRAV